MFQTEINLALQSAGSPPVTWLMWAVTALGYMAAYVVVLLTLAFAVRLRPALAVAGAVLLAGLATEAAKDAVAFPRPDEVDPRVAITKDARPLALTARGGGASFWSWPDPAAIEAVRRRAAGNYGFPSGHVGAAAAFLLGAAWFYRSRRALAFASAWVPLMALSRLYLGRHFLADVLGGLAIGVAAAGASFFLFRGALFRGAEPGDGPGPAPAATRRLWLLSLAILAAMPLVPVLHARYAGALVGLALSGTAIDAAGWPPDGGPWRRRAGRVAVGLFLFGASLLATDGLVRLAGGARFPAVLATAIVTTATLAGTVAVCRRLGWYGAGAAPGRAVSP